MISIDIAEFCEPDPVWLGLNDSSMLAGVVSSDYDPVPLTDDFVREQLRIHLCELSTNFCGRRCESWKPWSHKPTVMRRCAWGTRFSCAS